MSKRTMVIWAPVCAMWMAWMGGCSDEGSNSSNGGSGGVSAGGSNGQGEGGVGGQGGNQGGQGPGGSAGTSVAGQAGSNPGPSVADGCKAIADALCDKRSSCASLSITNAYGDEETCSERLQGSCTRSMALPGLGMTPEGLVACSTAYTAASCSDVLTGKLPAACDPPGNLPNGSVCGDDWQCKSTQCFVDAGSTCGVCKARQPVGGACTALGDCERGLGCSSSKVCVGYKQAGETCGDGICGPGLACFGPTGAKKCGIAPGLGEKCDPSGVSGASSCAPSSGAFCNLNSKACQAYKTASKGGTCDPSNGPVICIGSACRSGTCQAFTADGEKCDANTAPCQSPATCSGGRCVLVDPAKCK